MRFCSRHAWYVLTVISFVLSPIRGTSQVFEQVMYPFTIEGKSLAFPLAGGMNAPQFSQGDFGGVDGKDLLVFDRGGQVSMIFTRQSTGEYSYDREATRRLPKMEDWALARDYDDDGVIDLFTQGSPIPGIRVYRGTRESGSLEFNPVVFPGDLQVITYQTSSGNAANAYSASTDIPAIEDIDGDGDLDILSFESGGSYVAYFRNTSVESGYDSDSLHFVLEDECWGKFIESALTNDVMISSDPTRCAGSGARSGLHSGSTIGATDIDLDGDFDIFLGDLSFSNVVALINEGTPERAYVSSSDPGYPSTEPIDIRFFPAIFFVDLDGDRLKEMIAAPNERDSRNRSGITFLYEPTLGDNGINYNKTQTGFLHDEMLDFGTESFPLFIDLDGDGLQDVLVGSRYALGADLDTPGALYAFRNIGSKLDPAFELIDSDFLNLSTVSQDQTDALAPAAHDMDGDGDLDLIIGNKVGKLYYVENISQNTEFLPAGVQYPWLDIDVGFSSYPCIHDINQDGLPDLLLGEEIGNINYFENTGSASSPSFISDPEVAPNNKNFGLIDSRQGASVFGFSTPTIVKSVGETQLLVGSKIGNFLIYTLDSSNGNNPIQIADHPISGIKDGERSKCQFADLNEDGYYEMMTGNSRGGIVAYTTPFRSELPLAQTELAPDFFVDIYPNPTADFMYITSDETIEKVILMDVSGNDLNEIVQSNSERVDLADFRPGVYFVKLIGRNGIVVKKIMKSN